MSVISQYFKKRPYNSVTKRRTNQFKRWAKDLNKNIPLRKTNKYKHIKIYSTSLSIREIQINIRIRYHSILTRLAKIKD